MQNRPSEVSLAHFPEKKALEQYSSPRVDIPYWVNITDSPIDPGIEKESATSDGDVTLPLLNPIKRIDFRRTRSIDSSESTGVLVNPKTSIFQNKIFPSPSP